MKIVIDIPKHIEDTEWFRQDEERFGQDEKRAESEDEADDKRNNNQIDS